MDDGRSDSRDGRDRHAFELFLDAMLGQDVPLVGVREAARRSAVMEAMYEAAKTKTWVELK